MKTIDKAAMDAVYDEIYDADDNYAEVRRIVSAHIDLCDLIPADLIDDALTLAEWMYKPTDKGRKGKHDEAIDRVYMMVDCEGVEAIPFKEFFAHSQKDTDIYDSSIKTGYEKKTGTGDWLYFEEDDFDACIRMYARKRTKIRWDYVRADKGINIHIETSYRRFFRYLEAYNPSKGLSTWFVKSSRKYSDGLKKKTVWKMQEIMTSQKKIAYLNDWKG